MGHTAATMDKKALCVIVLRVDALLQKGWTVWRWGENVKERALEPHFRVWKSTGTHIFRIFGLLIRTSSRAGVEDVGLV